MKELILAILGLITLASNVNADSPTDKGVYSLSGSISYSRTTYDSTNGGDSKRIIVTPAFKYFIYPNLAIGSSILYSYFKTDISEIKKYGVGPVVRYYFGKDTIYPFISVEYTYTKNKSGLSSESDGSDLSFGFGIDYFLSKNVALEPMVRYTYSSDEVAGTTYRIIRGEDLFIGIGINVFIF